MTAPATRSPRHGAALRRGAASARPYKRSVLADDVLNRPEPPSIGAVAALLAMDRTTLTAALKSLARRGLVEVTADPADRRSRVLTLTPARRALLSSAVPIWTRSHAAVEDLLGGSDPDLLRTDLRSLS